jgi:hypothetical protein
MALSTLAATEVGTGGATQARPSLQTTAPELA